MKYAFSLLFGAIALVCTGTATAAELGQQLTINQWVRLAEDGTLNGRLMATSLDGSALGVDGVEVTVQQDGGEAFDATSNVDGEFSITGVTPGIYSLTARGETSFASCAMHVVGSDVETARDLPIQSLISLADVDQSIVQGAMVRYLPPTFEPIRHSIEEADLTGLRTRVVSDHLFKVAQTDGGLSGVIYAAGAEADVLEGAAMTNVFVLREGTEVARITTEDDGSFRLDDMEAGVYSVIAVGPDGIGSIGFQLIAEDDLATAAIIGRDGTSLIQDFAPAGSLGMQVAPPVGGGVGSDVLLSEQIVGPCTTCGDVPGVVAPISGCNTCGAAGGGFAGGGIGGYGGVAGGAGGFGGGLAGGGLGRLALLGGLGAAIAIAASDDDDDDISNPVVTSPNGPTSGNDNAQGDNDAQGDDSDQGNNDDQSNDDDGNAQTTTGTTTTTGSTSSSGSTFNDGVEFFSPSVLTAN